MSDVGKVPTNGLSIEEKEKERKKKRKKREEDGKSSEPSPL